MDLRLTAAGLLVGTIAGMTGIGGSSLLAPILILVFGVKAAIAVGTDLIYSVPMKALAAWAHVRQGTIDLRVVKLLALGGIPGALAGLAVFAFIRARAGAPGLEPLLRHAIGIVIICAAAATLVLMLAARFRPAERTASPPSVIVAIGAVVGFLVALTSIGSGSITLPLLVLALPALRLRALIGSEIVFAAVMIPVAAAGHVAFANVDWTMALSLTAGALPGAYLGARLCAVIGEQSLRPVVICALAFAGFKLL